MMQMPELKDSRLTLERGVAVLTLDRDDVRNALTGTGLIDDIVSVADWVNVNDAVSVLVITGAGKAFSAGGNIKDMRDRAGDFGGDVAEVENRYRRGIQRIPLAMERIEVPVIAAVNGPAIGAGFDLANMADLRLAARSARFGETFLNLGIIPGDGGAWIMQRLIGYQRAFELTLSGRIIDAEEARELGLLLDVVDDAELMPEAMALAERMAAQPRAATRLTKRLMKSARRMELPDFLDLCACFQGMCHNNEEHLTAVQRFLDQAEKRRPR